MSVTMKELLEAGVHFGHQTKRWNPKMKPYIFGARNGIHIIDLQKTVKLFTDSYEFIKNSVLDGKKVLFVGTKKQAQETVKEESERAGMYFVNNRWLGGMLTNFKTIQASIKKLKELEAMMKSGDFGTLKKKEVGSLEKERQKLEKNLGGIKNMGSLPDIMFVIDPKKEYIAVKEARKVGVTVVGVVDTNCDPEELDYVIPGNDDAIRAIKLICHKIADAIIAGMEAKKEKETTLVEGADVVEEEDKNEETESVGEELQSQEAVKE